MATSWASSSLDLVLPLTFFSVYINIYIMWMCVYCVCVCVCALSRIKSLWLLYLTLAPRVSKMELQYKLNPSARKSFWASSIFFQVIHLNKRPFTIPCDASMNVCSSVYCVSGLVIQWRAQMISTQGHEHPSGLCMQPQRHWSCQVSPRAQCAKQSLPQCKTDAMTALCWGSLLVS